MPAGLHASHKDVLRDSMNLKVLTYKPVNDHKQLRLSLQALIDLVEAGREELRKNSEW